MNYPASELVIDPVLFRRHDVSGPRYTSYPTADRFVEAFGETALKQWLAKRNIGGISQPLSLYVHLPFCNTVCYYCACNKVVTRDKSQSAKYIQYLDRELAGRLSRFWVWALAPSETTIPDSTESAKATAVSLRQPICV